MSKVVMLEFNELCPDLIDKFMVAGLLPNFQKLHDRSEVYLTNPDVEQQQCLEPWIQWYSIHTGLDYAQHQVFNLGDGQRADHPDIWSILLENGRKVVNFSSMNARSFNRQGSVFFPDPWCINETPSPSELNDLYNFISYSVQEYTNPEKGSGSQLRNKFIQFAVTHGLKISTIAKIGKQLLHEKVKPAAEGWKRAMILDRVLFDIFAYYYKKERPDFATFFSNSVAHYQHGYWRYMAPGSFNRERDHEKEKIYGNAIQQGYENLDYIVGRVLDLVDDDTVIIFTTALSQQPDTRWDDRGGQKFFRPKDMDSLLRRFEIDYRSLEPVMTHQYQIGFADEKSLAQAKERLEGLTLDGKQVFGFGSNSQKGFLFLGCQIFSDVDPEAMLSSGHSNQQIRFYDLFYLIDETKSGLHHPDGSLWISSAKPHKHDTRASILDILPTLLDYFGIPVPADKKYSYTGKSLRSF